MKELCSAIFMVLAQEGAPMDARQIHAMLPSIDSVALYAGLSNLIKTGEVRLTPRRYYEIAPEEKGHERQTN